MVDTYRFCPCCASPLEEKRVENIDRKFCSSETCGFAFWDNPTPIVAALVEHDEKIILAHNTSWPSGMYSLITGYLERNEHPDIAVVREVKEELGLEGQIEKFLGHYVFKPKNQLMMAYWIKASGDISLGHELDDFKAIEKSNLKTWQFGAGQVVADWLAGHQKD